MRDVKLGVTAGQLKVSTTSKTRLFDVVGAPYGVKVEVAALNASGSADWSTLPKSWQLPPQPLHCQQHTA